MRTQRVVWMGILAASALSCASTVLAAADGASGNSAGLVEVVIRSTEQYRDPAAAVADDYLSANACVSGPEEGAMGVHFVKGALVDGTFDPTQPEALIYEVRKGRARLVGVEYIVIAEAWHAHTVPPPVIMGQQTHFVNSPNRYGLPAFYELHVWAWRPNPKGTFVDWNPTVSCAGFEPAETAPTATASHAHGRP